MEPEKRRTVDRRKIELRRKKRNIDRLIRMCIFFFSFVAMFILLFIFKTNAYVHYIFGGLFKTTVSTESVITLQSGKQQVEAQGVNLVACATDGIRILNTRDGGKETSRIPFNYSSNVMDCRDDYILVYDRGNTDLMVINDKEILKSIKFDYPIVTAKINNEGYLGVITQERGYKGQVIVYNPKGQEMYRWHSGENYLLDVDISYDGKSMVISALDSGKDHVVGIMLFFNLGENTPFVMDTLDNTIVPRVKFNYNKSVIAIGDNMTILYDQRGSRKKDINYKGRPLDAYSLDSDNLILLAFASRDLERPVLEIYNTYGDLKAKYECEASVKHISINRDMIGIVFKREVTLLSSLGKEIVTTPLERNVDNVVFIGGKTYFAVSGGNNIEVFKIN